MRDIQSSSVRRTRSEGCLMLGSAATALVNGALLMSPSICTLRFGSSGLPLELGAAGILVDEPLSSCASFGEGAVKMMTSAADPSLSTGTGAGCGRSGIG